MASGSETPVPLTGTTKETSNTVASALPATSTSPHSPRSPPPPAATSPRSPSSPSPPDPQSPIVTPPDAPTAQAAPIDVDQEWVDDADSAIGDDVSTYSASLTSEVWKHSYEYGRRYHAYKESSEYIRPNDEVEVDRLDMMHHIFKLIKDGKLFEASVPKTVQRVLDLGCGTGIWAMDFADEYPSAEVLGIDISPIQPNLVPPNVKFEIDDIEEEFAHPQPFDYIHCRYMAYAVKNWSRLVQQVYNHTASGGTAEFTDYDLTYRSDDGTLDNTTLKAWGDDMPRAGRMIGREPCPGLYLETWMREAGFTNIMHKVYKIPIGPWAADKHHKVLGAYNFAMLNQGAEAFSLRLFINVLGWSYEEVQVLLAKVKSDLKDRRIHAYTEMHCVWGQKSG